MSRVVRPRRTPLLGALLASALVPALLVLPGARRRSLRPVTPAVLGKTVIGHSVKGRAITAYHLGEPGKKKVVLISVMHGNEPAPRRILTDLVDGAPVHGIDLWVVPVYNPDGLARHTRRNAHGVDLNRNYPYKWIRQTGNYDSGPRPRSEPETRAMMRFLRVGRPGVRPVVPPAAARRRRHRAAGVLQEGGPRARPADCRGCAAAAAVTAR